MIFIFAFLPICVALTFSRSETSFKNFVLIIGSLLFFWWGRPLSVLLIFLTCVCDFIIALLCQKVKSKALKFTLLAADAAVNLLGIAVSALYYSALDTVMFDTPIKLMVSFGLLFYFLRGFLYVRDICFSDIKAETNPLVFLAYMTSFTAVLGAPFGDFEEVREKFAKRGFSLSTISEGLVSFVFGLFEIVILVPEISKAKLSFINGGVFTFLGSVFSLFLFALEFFTVLSGFTLMSKGMSKILGICPPSLYNFYVKVRPRKSVCAAASDIALPAYRVISPLLEFNINKTGIFFPCAVCGLLAVLAAITYALAFYWISFVLLLALFGYAEKTVLRKFFEKFPLANWFYTFAAFLISFVILCFPNTYYIGQWIAGFSFANGFVSESQLSALTQSSAAAAVSVLAVSPAFGLISQKLEKTADKDLSAYGIFRVSRTVICVILLVLSVSALAKGI